MDYWKERLAQIAERQELKQDKTLKQLKTAYNKALKEIDREIANLYVKMLEGGEISPLEAYKYGRYRDFQEQMTKILKELGQVEVENLQLTLMDAYRGTYAGTSALVGVMPGNMVMEAQLLKAVEQGWLGSNYSARIWANKSKLLSSLDKMMIDCIALGKSKDETIKQIMATMGSGFSDTDRLVRTELMFIINQSQKDVYMGAGYSDYEVLSALDSRTSNICEEQDGKTYSFSEAVVGKNYPPFHPRCRTTVVPVL